MELVPIAELDVPGESGFRTLYILLQETVNGLKHIRFAAEVLDELGRPFGAARFDLWASEL